MPNKFEGAPCMLLKLEPVVDVFVLLLPGGGASEKEDDDCPMEGLCCWFIDMLDMAVFMLPILDVFEE